MNYERGESHSDTDNVADPRYKVGPQRKANLC